MKKRILSVMLTLVTAGMLVAGCGSSTTETADTGSTTGSESAAGETATGGTENTATESLIPAGEESDKLLELQKNGIRIGYCNVSKMTVTLLVLKLKSLRQPARESELPTLFQP